MTTRASYKYGEGEEYHGEWNAHGKRHGLGHLTLANGTKYTGRFENGFCSGHGVMSFADGSRYEGEFAGGRFSGVGVFTRCDGMKFEGEFRDGKVNGLGLLTFADGTHGLPRNEGYFQGNELKERRQCNEVIRKARNSATVARSQHL
ncbi:MORN repeat-containing protein 4-like [Branchiostoma floridae x Branchiostoma belcheri]